MAINTQQLISRLSPLSAIDTSGFGGLDRQRLALMREQFEETKRQHEQELELHKLEEEGRMARERMQSERASAEAAAKAAAEREKVLQETQAKFAELNGKGDFEGARMLVPSLVQHGKNVDLIGMRAGIPDYEITDAEAPEKEIASTDDAFSRAQQASSYAAETGAPYRRTLSGTESGIADARAATVQRLDPALGALVQAYPITQQNSAEATKEAVLASGLPANEALKQYSALRSGPDSAVNAETMARAQGGQHANDRFNKGFEHAEKTFKTVEADKKVSAIEAAGQIREILKNETKEDDYQIANWIVALSGGKGTQTEPDIARAVGMKASSTLDQIVDYIQTKLEGGVPEGAIKGILSYVESRERRSKNEIFAWMDNIDQAAKSDDPDRARGMANYRDTVLPRVLRQEYEAAKKAARSKKGTQPAEGAKPTGAAAEKPAAAAAASAVAQADPTSDEPDELTSAFERPAGTPGSALEGPPAPPAVDDSDEEFQNALSLAMDERGLDARKALRVIGPESKGRRDAKNPGSSARGIIQMLDETARDFTNPRTGKKFKDSKEFSDLSRVEQAGVAAEYFARKGVTSDSPEEDYMLAVAAPAFVGKSEDRDAVVYEKGTKQHTKNKPWWPEGGGDITVGSILDFYQGKRGKLAKAETTGESAEDRAAAFLKARGL